MEGKTDLLVKTASTRKTQRGTFAVCNVHPGRGSFVPNRRSTSFAVSATRVFGLWNARTAFAASLTSKYRFAMCCVAPKTSSDRIVTSSKRDAKKMCNSVAKPGCSSQECRNAPSAITSYGASVLRIRTHGCERICFRGCLERAVSSGHASFMTQLSTHDMTPRQAHLRSAQRALEKTGSLEYAMAEVLTAQ
jgi:hypothetical protein